MNTDLSLHATTCNFVELMDLFLTFHSTIVSINNVIWCGFVETPLDLCENLVVELAEGRHTNYERGALLNLTLHIHLAAHLLNKLLTNTDSEANAMLVNAFVLLQALEISEKRLKAILAYTEASVDNLYFEFNVVDIIYGLRDVGLFHMAWFEIRGLLRMLYKLKFLLLFDNFIIKLIKQPFISFFLVLLEHVELIFRIVEIFERNFYCHR